MNRIDQTFASLKQQNKTAMMPYLTVGDPDIRTTVDIILELESAGADIIELGVPQLSNPPDVLKRSGETGIERFLCA